jgi:uncharacterized protein (DUF1697 family)
MPAVQSVTIIAMPKYIAFLKAINVGGHVVKMDYLRKLFEEMGFSNVKTFIASGNVIFDSTSKSVKALEKKIEEFLHSRLGYKVATFIRSTAELAEVAKNKPFKDFDPDAKSPSLFVGFFPDPPAKDCHKKIQMLNSKTDEFHLAGREIYWLCRSKFTETKISYAVLEKLLGMQGTFRNSTTVRRIAAQHCV